MVLKLSSDLRSEPVIDAGLAVFIVALTVLKPSEIGFICYTDLTLHIINYIL